MEAPVLDTSRAAASGVARPLVSVVIATRNRAERLAAQLAALRAQTLPPDDYEVIVVDDASTDDTPALLAAAGVRVLRHDAPHGPGAARNAGWRAARGALIAFTDDDCEAHPDWLAAGLRAWGGDPLALVQGATGVIERERDRLGPFAYAIEVGAPSAEFETCNVFYPRALLERLGGFDAPFGGPQGEDTDLAWRAIAAGARPRFAAAARVDHAVVGLGAAGMLRRAWSWPNVALAFRRHAELRRVRLFRGVFWNWTHYLVARAALALPLARSRATWPLAWWLARRLLAYEVERARGHGRLALVPSLLAHDCVETAAIVRGAIRHRTVIV